MNLPHPTKHYNLPCCTIILQALRQNQNDFLYDEIESSLSDETLILCWPFKKKKKTQSQQINTVEKALKGNKLNISIANPFASYLLSSGF